MEPVPVQSHHACRTRKLIRCIALSLAVCGPLLMRTTPCVGQDALATAKQLEEALVEAIGRAERSVVAIARVPPGPSIAAEDLNPFRRPEIGIAADPRDPNFIPESFGSGVVLAHPDPNRAHERYVLTTYHVALGSLRPSAEERQADVDIYVTLADRRVVPAELRRVDGQIHAADPYIDLAVLKLDLESAGLTADDLPPIPRGDAETLRKGRLVIALGNPYAQARDGSASASLGMISNISRRPEPDDGGASLSDDQTTLHSFGTLLHVDSRLDLGLSGGALVNLDGELVGITTSLAALRGYEKSVGYAVPLDAATWRIVEELLHGWEVDLGFMGIAPRTLTRRDMRLEGYDRHIDQPTAVQAALVSVDSPAWEAGLRQNDVILSIGPEPMYDATDLMRTVALAGPDAIVEVYGWRPQSQRQFRFRVRLGKLPVGDDSTTISSASRYPTWRGMEVNYPTARRRFLASDVLAARYPQAVVVTDVAAESPAAQAGLTAGDFIQQVGESPVQTPAEFYAAVATRTDDVPLTLTTGETLTISPPQAPP